MPLSQSTKRTLTQAGYVFFAYPLVIYLLLLALALYFYAVTGEWPSPQATDPELIFSPGFLEIMRPLLGIAVLFLAPIPTILLVCYLVLALKRWSMSLLINYTLLFLASMAAWGADLSFEIGLSDWFFQ